MQIASRIVPLLLICSIYLSGCGMQLSSETPTEQTKSVGEQLLTDVLIAATSSYIDSLEYRYPISDSFREEQIAKIVKEEIDNKLKTMEFLDGYANNS